MGALADQSAESMASVRSVVVSAVANLVVVMAIIATAALVLALAHRSDGSLASVRSVVVSAVATLVTVAVAATLVLLL